MRELDGSVAWMLGVMTMPLKPDNRVFRFNCMRCGSTGTFRAADGDYWSDIHTEQQGYQSRCPECSNEVYATMDMEVKEGAEQ